MDPKPRVTELQRVLLGVIDRAGCLRVRSNRRWKKSLDVLRARGIVVWDDRLHAYRRPAVVINNRQSTNGNCWEPWERYAPPQPSPQPTE